MGRPQGSAGREERFRGYMEVSKRGKLWICVQRWLALNHRLGALDKDIDKLEQQLAVKQREKI